jgi:hypothetical protein
VAPASVEDLARASTAVGDLIANILPDQWNAPTPCTEWAVQDVVEHLVAMNLVFAALINEGPMPERGADHLGKDPAEAYWASAASLHAAFAQPGVLERSYVGPLGSAPLAPSDCKSGSMICSLTDGTSCRPPEFVPTYPRISRSRRWHLFGTNSPPRREPDDSPSRNPSTAPPRPSTGSLGFLDG